MIHFKGDFFVLSNSKNDALSKSLELSQRKKC